MNIRLNSMARLFTQLALLSSFIALSFAARAELSIQITQGVDNPIPISVVPFTNEGGGFLSEDIAQIVTNDLEQVGEFKALSPANMLSLPSQESEVFYRDWGILA